MSLEYSQERQKMAGSLTLNWWRNYNRILTPCKGGQTVTSLEYLHERLPIKSIDYSNRCQEYWKLVFMTSLYIIYNVVQTA